MADRMTDYFHAHKECYKTHDILSHKHAFHVRACEKTAVFVMHATGVYSVYISRHSHIVTSGTAQAFLGRFQRRFTQTSPLSQRNPCSSAPESMIILNRFPPDSPDWVPDLLHIDVAHTCCISLYSSSPGSSESISTARAWAFAPCPD